MVSNSVSLLGREVSTTESVGSLTHRQNGCCAEHREHPEDLQGWTSLSEGKQGPGGFSQRHRGSARISAWAVVSQRRPLDRRLGERSEGGGA